MFTCLNKILKTSRKAMSRKEGQVAVILILVVAAALVFYAISLNLGRISQAKVVTTIAADTGASTLASFMASFGQSIFKTTLGGKKKVCGWTGVLVSIIVVIIAIISLIVAIFCAPCGMSIWMAAVSLVLALAALVMQAAVIQPGLTDKWNEIITELMDQEDAFTEQGVQRALTSVATDSVLVPDLDDADQDRVFGLDVNGDPLDKVSRFGFYYTQRLNTIPVPVSAEVQDFLDGLKNFLLDNGDNWGLIDDTGPVCTPFSTSSECNPCCLPLGVRDSSSCGDTPVYDSEGNLIEYTENPGIQSACKAGSPYGDGTNSNYPWVYDAYRGNPTNTFVSLQEQLGRDDEHRDFRKNPLDPNGLQTSVTGDGFRLEDTTGFHAADNRIGVFPFFYKTADWKVNLNTVTEPFDLANKPHQCHWCDADDLTAGSGTVGACPADQPAEAPQLVLPIDPATLIYNRTYCVDGTTPVSGTPPPPLAVDLVRLPDLTDAIWTLGYNGGVNDAVIPLIGKIEEDADQCAQDARGNPDIGFWKRGGDMFCSVGGDDWPYSGQCLKFGSCPEDDGSGGTVDPGCACGESGAMPPVNFPDDSLDDLVYGLNSFADWAREMLAQDAASLGSTFSTWYPDAAGWIEPGSSTDPAIGSGAMNNSIPYCYVCAPEDGTLHVWWKQIQEMQNRLQAWHDTSFASTACSEVWCVPDAGCPGPFGKDSSALGGLGTEQATFDSNGNGTPGDIADVAACLNWNVNDTVTTSDGVMTATGNAEKFLACYTACQSVSAGIDGGVDVTAEVARAMELCSALPRSLVPGFDGISFTAPDAVSKTKGSCGLSGFMTTLNQSNLEAQNQVAKFRQRHTFLSGRLAEMDNLLSVLGGAEEKFREFLTCVDTDIDGFPDGPACGLTKARIDFDSTEHGLPYHAIYGWQSEPAEKGMTCEDADPVDGKPDGGGCTWHIARVDARIPQRCDRACGESQLAGSDPLWPWVKTFTKSLGMKRCYELTSTTGVVKVRVTRFDETSASATLLFPNAVEIWKQIFERQDRSASSDPKDIESVCIGSMVPNPGDSVASLGSYYYGAFMLNKRLQDEPDPGCLAACAGVLACETACVPVSNYPCWDLANHLLSRGVTSEACAKYYFHEAGTTKTSLGGVVTTDVYGMDFKFVPCLNF